MDTPPLTLSKERKKERKKEKEQIDIVLIIPVEQ